MQGRVREGGDHLAALMRECKADTRFDANTCADRRNYLCGIGFAPPRFYPTFPFAPDRFSLFPGPESALSLVFRSFATADIHSCNAAKQAKKWIEFS
jgi:hypothetical protein